MLLSEPVIDPHCRMPLLLRGLSIIFQERYARITGLQRQNRETETDIRELQRMTSDIRRSKVRFKSDAEFVQRVARELGLVCPHETVFQFVEPAVR